MTTPLPQIGVMPQREWPGAKDLVHQAPDLCVADLRAVYETPWPTDAHMVTYQPSDGTNPFPRCNKPVLGHLRKQGIDLLATVMVLDYDTPGHKPWQDGELALFLDKLQQVAETWPLAWQWTVLHTTRNGARLVYVLSDPIPVDQSEAKHLWLCREFTAHGIEMDDNSDWTHLYRLPYVVRDGKPTQDVLFIPQWDNRLDTDCLGTASQVKETSQYAPIVPLDDPMPSADDVQAILEVMSSSTGRFQHTQWRNDAKARLKGRECYPCIFENAAIAKPTERDTTIHHHVGEAIAMLMPLVGTTPAHIFALFHAAIEQLEPDTNTPNWLAVLWDHVCRIWAKERAKTEYLQQQEKATEEKVQDTRLTMYQGVKQWHPQAPDGPQEASDWLDRHLIVSIAANYMLMGPDGYYENMQLGPHQIIPRIRASHLDKMIKTQKWSDKKEWVDIPVTALTNSNVTVVSAIEAVPCSLGAHIKDVDTPGAKLIMPSYSRNKLLEPTYDKDVDAWLQHLFGENYKLARDWIAWSLAFDEGAICALSLMGAPGVGKKLLSHGLAETLTGQPKSAGPDELIGEHQYRLLETPFMVINEGWPRSATGKKPSEHFKALVSADDIQCKRKYMAPVTLKSPMRIILTANNKDLVQTLIADKEQTPESREAIAVRLLHFNVGKKAANWLREKGGMSFTGRDGHRWIEGDSGEPSDFVVAKHFLWLWSRRGVRPGERFLVDGGNCHELMFDMQTRGGATPLVIEAIIKLMNVTNTRGITIENGKVYALVSAVLEYFRMNMGSYGRLSANTISDVFRNLSVVENDKRVRLESRKGMGFMHWYELDTQTLLQAARQDGWTCNALEGLATDRELQNIKENTHANDHEGAGSVR